MIYVHFPSPFSLLLVGWGPEFFCSRFLCCFWQTSQRGLNNVPNPTVDCGESRDSIPFTGLSPLFEIRFFVHFLKVYVLVLLTLLSSYEMKASLLPSYSTTNSYESDNGAIFSIFAIVITWEKMEPAFSIQSVWSTPTDVRDSVRSSASIMRYVTSNQRELCTACNI